MARKPKMERVTEPSTGHVHYESDPLSGNVTLCGLTDWIGVTPGEPTRAPLTCKQCESIFNWCNQHAA